MNSTPAIIFYDGQCALCHGSVKYVLRNDKRGEFRYSPLQGETLKKLVSAEQISELPDSVVVRAFAGELFCKSDAVIYVLQRLGPVSRALAILVSVFPKVIRESCYDFVASVRKKIFGTKTDFCPIVPEALRERFLP